MSARVCRIGIISWPVKNRTTEKGYVILGELYDRDKRTDVQYLLRIHNELRYLYPFRCRKINNEYTFYNIEDFRAIQNRFKLTTKFRFIGLSGKTITFRSPVLYDLSCMVPVVKSREQDKHSSGNEYKIRIDDRICFIVSHPDPIVRGKMLDIAIEKGYCYLVLPGLCIGKNRDSNGTLMRRYLLKNHAPAKIIKVEQEMLIDAIMEGLFLVGLLNCPKLLNEIIVVCPASSILHIKNSLRWWRKTFSVPLRITYQVLEDEI